MYLLVEVPSASLRLWPLRWNSFDEGVSRCSAGALQIRLPKGRMLLVKIKDGSKRIPKRPTRSQKGAKMSQ